jgi:hypothetical protein
MLKPIGHFPVKPLLGLAGGEYVVGFVKDDQLGGRD